MLDPFPKSVEFSRNRNGLTTETQDSFECDGFSEGSEESVPDLAGQVQCSQDSYRRTEEKHTRRIGCVHCVFFFFFFCCACKTPRISVKKIHFLKWKGISQGVSTPETYWNSFAQFGTNASPVWMGLDVGAWEDITFCSCFFCLSPKSRRNGKKWRMDV